MAQVTCSLSIVFLFLTLAFVVEVFAGSTNGGPYIPAGAEGSVHIEECPDKCYYRCSTTSPKKLCTFFCNICSKRCLCVPSGTSGNKEECPCYGKLKTCP